MHISTWAGLRLRWGNLTQRRERTVSRRRFHASSHRLREKEKDLAQAAGKRLRLAFTPRKAEEAPSSEIQRGMLAVTYRIWVRRARQTGAASARPR